MDNVMIELLENVYLFETECDEPSEIFENYVFNKYKKNFCANYPYCHKVICAGETLCSKCDNSHESEESFDEELQKSINRYKSQMRQKNKSCTIM